MNAPKQIKFRSVVYVKVEATHKKCPVGSHWNVKQNKCMKLSGVLLKHHNNAKKATQHANSPKNLHNDPKTMHKNQAKASDLHTKAAKHARKEGFHALARRHESFAKHHDGLRSSEPNWK